MAGQIFPGKSKYFMVCLRMLRLFLIDISWLIITPGHLTTSVSGLTCFLTCLLCMYQRTNKIMSECMRRNFSSLKLLQNASNARRKHIIQSPSKDFILTLCEIALNVLKGKVPLNKTHYKMLKKNKEGIRPMADKRCSCQRRRSSSVRWISLTSPEYNSAL